VRRERCAEATEVFVALGSNLQDRLGFLAQGLRELSRLADTTVLAISSVYETEPVGGPSPQAFYLNAVAQMRTNLEPLELLQGMQAIEHMAGRVRTSVRGAARTLDLDLLLYGEECLETPELIVPHPRMHERAFVLEPLAELAPVLVHPRLGVSVAHLVAAVEDSKVVRKTALRIGINYDLIDKEY